MTYPYEELLREHQRAVREQASRSRLIELARCCKPSALKAAVARLRDRFLPADPACC